MEPRSIRAIRAGAGRTLVVAWRGGTETVVDVAGEIGRYAIFEPLRTDRPAFARVSVGEWGWNAHWSDDMEIAADTLWRLALEQGAAWLRAWREARGLTPDEAATAIGVPARSWRLYEAGDRVLPKTIRLACIGLDAGRGGDLSAA